MTSTAIVPTDAPPSEDLSPSPTSFQSVQRAQLALQSLSQIISLSPSSPTEDPASELVRDPAIASAVSLRLRHPSSGAGDDNLCRWLYDTFQSTEPSLQLAVLGFLPSVAGLYLSRCTGHRHCQPLAGFEAVLLALYAHQTLARNGDPLTVRLPNLSSPNPYLLDPTSPTTKATKTSKPSTDLDPVAATAVLSHKLDPHGTMRSTRRARVVGVALELYYTRIDCIPNRSKLDFCRFASAWAGPRQISQEEVPKEEFQDCATAAAAAEEEDQAEEKGQRIPLPWELIQPSLRILGHCLLAPSTDEELKKAAAEAVEGLYNRAVHDMNTQAVLATRSLMRLGAMPEPVYEPPAPSAATEISNSAETAIVAV